MALNLRVNKTFPGFGGGGVLNDTVLYQAGIALSTTGQQSSPIPATGVILGTTTGKIRFKIYNGGGTSPTLVDLLITASDGTNTIPLFAFHPTVALALNTTNWYDHYFEYLLDTAASGSGGGAVGQLLPGGATSFSVKTTLGGTNPTASMDLEIVPLV